MKKLCVALVCQRSPKVPVVFESARRNGFELFLVMAPGEEVSFDEHADVIRGACTLDVFTSPSASAASFLAAMADNGISGAVTTREEAIPWVADVCRRLGRPALSEAASLACRDKDTMRKALAAHGLNQPRSKILGLAEAKQLLDAGTLALPLVLKPRFGMGSLGVVKVDSIEQLELHYRESSATSRRVLAAAVGKQPYFGETLLVEEFIEGPEIVADTFSVDGEVRVLSVAYKGDAPGPYFERSVYEAPYEMAPQVEQAVREQVVRGLQAVGLRDGPSHTEMRLRDGVEPYIIEIGARIGGSGVSAFIVHSSVGIDPFYLQVLQACGLPLGAQHTTPRYRRFGGNFVIPMQGDGTFVAYHGLAEVRAHPATRHMVTFFQPGLFAEPIPKFFGYPGFIMSQHEDSKSLRDFHRGLFDSVRVEWAPRA